MDQNKLANLFLQTINKKTDKTGTLWLNQTEIWELANTLAAMAQPRKKYQDLYNSPEGRMEREKLMKNK